MTRIFSQFQALLTQQPPAEEPPPAAPPPPPRQVNTPGDGTQQGVDGNPLPPPPPADQFKPGVKGGPTGATFVEVQPGDYMTKMSREHLHKRYTEAGLAPPSEGEYSQYTSQVISANPPGSVVRVGTEQTPEKKIKDVDLIHPGDKLLMPDTQSFTNAAKANAPRALNVPGASSAGASADPSAGAPAPEAAGPEAAGPQTAGPETAAPEASVPGPQAPEPMPPAPEGGATPTPGPKAPEPVQPPSQGNTPPGPTAPETPPTPPAPGTPAPAPGPVAETSAQTTRITQTALVHTLGTVNPPVVGAPAEKIALAISSRSAAGQPYDQDTLVNLRAMGVTPPQLESLSNKLLETAAKPPTQEQVNAIVGVDPKVTPTDYSARSRNWAMHAQELGRELARPPDSSNGTPLPDDRPFRRPIGIVRA